MKDAIGTALALVAATALGWFGIAWGYVGGTEQAIRGFEANPAYAHDVAWGLVRVIIVGNVAAGLALAIVFLLVTAWFG